MTANNGHAAVDRRTARKLFSRRHGAGFREKPAQDGLA